MTEDFINRVVELTNIERAKRGLPPLSLNSQLTAAAMGHSTSMAIDDFVDHIGIDGSNPADRVTNAGYQFAIVAENVSAGPPTPEQVLIAWMNSPSHSANILNADVTEIGVGYYFLANDTGNKNQHHYWTQVFATSPPDRTPVTVDPTPIPPSNVISVSAPLIPSQSNPFYTPGFFDLNFTTTSGDRVQLTPGALNGYQLGLRALDGNDIVVGSSDGETMNGNQGRDRLFGDGGADYLRGGKDDDQVIGGEADDILNGNNDNDTVFGGEGNDIVRGGKGNDRLLGEAGNDVLIGDFGQDIRIGGSGGDLFVLRRDTAVGVFDAQLADWIVDLNVLERDKIGLTDGLTPNDLDYTQIVDVDGSSLADTVIKLKATGEILGVVLDRNPLDLVTVFEPVSTQILSMG